jgi:REP element-mobilizing transposase RayT
VAMGASSMRLGANPAGRRTARCRRRSRNDIAPGVFVQFLRTTCRWGDMQCQRVLFGKENLGDPPSLEHGGDVRLGKRKITRPLDAKKPLHIVLRSSRARREWSMLRPSLASRIAATARRLARRHDVRLYRYANVGNHIHILGQARSRKAFQAFLRGFAGVAARIVTGARRGMSVDRFWDRLAYSRIVSWGREYRAVRAYVRQNEEEALGVRSYQDRKRRRLGRSSSERPPPGRGTSPPGRVSPPSTTRSRRSSSESRQ